MLTQRTVTIVLAFAVGAMASAVLVAVGVALAARVGVSVAEWIAPLSLVVCVAAALFAVRRRVLPRDVYTTPGVALVWVASWVVISLGAALFIWWPLRGVVAAADVGHGTFVTILACVFLVLAPVERLAERPRTGLRR